MIMMSIGANKLFRTSIKLILVLLLLLLFFFGGGGEWILLEGKLLE